MTTQKPQPRSLTTGKLIRLTDLAWQIASEHAASDGYDGVSDWLEYLVLCQQFSPPEALALWRQRTRRGGLGGVRVVPDVVRLPPEG